jgi:hypothetical protein
MNNIKNVKPNAKSGFKQGYFDVSESVKYRGELPCIYRSSWEKKFMIYAESNASILAWSSEPFKIKYWNILDKKYHYYYPDYWVRVNRGDIIEDCIVEIKPKDQLKKPTKPKRLTKKTIANYNYACKRYIMNLCKIDALKLFAKNRGAKVILLTEDSWII